MSSKIVIEPLENVKNEKQELIIRGIKKIKFCYFCFSYNIANVWKKKEWTELVDEIKDFIKLRNLKTLEEEEIEHISLITQPEFKNGYFGYLTFEINRSYLLKIPYTVEICPHCKKSQGTYHEAIIQFRNVDNKIIREFAEELMKKEVFTKDAVEKDGGVDVKVTNKKIAKSIAKKFASKYNLEFKLTSKLITYNHEKGKKVFRDYILLRGVPSSKFVYYRGDFWINNGNFLVLINKKEKIKFPSSKEVEEVEIEELKKISEDKEGGYFMDKDYNIFYFKAKKVLKLKRGNEEKFYFE